MYTVKPNHWVLSKDPVLNDHFGSKLLSGSIVQKPNIQRFTENGVIFEGDKEVTEFDVVIMATGYTWKFPFLEEDILEREEGRINLYKWMFPPYLPHATLAIMVFILTFGPEFPSGELQARRVTQILADTKLLLKILFGPSVSYQYRLEGPHSWEGAREAIITTMDRVPLTSMAHDEEEYGRSVQQFL
ncbi:Dimethylaniline monooxygenase [N-oxide-forming] 2 [Araneus ventricosus]|uniref:Flavin-containing monooxygenase n=1 Tax=Araneus ventricosus TaxID=182803 RepID=A0A4Y2IKF7_ARAVE|nr:Dimethylaniline monooxygenase [N-oxide-forming] 2 [Araneus ventricosus]